MTRLLAGRSWVHILAGTRDFSLLRNVQGGSGPHPAPCSVGGYRLGREIDHSLVVPTSSMSGEVPFLPLMPRWHWTTTTTLALFYLFTT